MWTDARTPSRRWWPISLLPTLFLTSVILLPLAARAAEPRPQHDMVYIPAGEFLMGTSEEEAGRLAEQYGVHPTLFLTEAPQRTVRIEAFLIDRFPVTNAQYKQ